MLTAALTWAEAGCSIIPIAANGTKRPMIKWEDHIHQAASPEQITTWYTQWPNAGIAIVCGKVSGNLEMLELEGRATSSLDLDAIIEHAQYLEIDWLWNMLTQSGYAEWTPSGGIHLLYRITGGTVPGNTKIAQDENRLCLSETRGEAGYVVVAPSGGSVHKTGDSWSVAAGEIGVIPTISWEDRCLLHEAIKSALDKTPPPPVITERRPIQASRTGGISPGDDYSQRTSWHEILEPAGWKPVSQKSQETFWLHPNSTSGAEHSASTNYDGTDRLYVWSSSTPFIPETPYSKFAAYTVFAHGGDFPAAARELAQRGYGTREPRSTSTANLLLDSVETGRDQAASMGTAGQAISDTAPVHPSTPVELDPLGLPRYHDDVFDGMDWDGPGAAQVFVKAHKETFAYVASQSEWRKWQGDVWAPDQTLQHENAAVRMAERIRNYAKRAEQADPELGKNLRRSAKSLCSAQGIKGILGIARSNHSISASEDAFDKNPALVTMPNGVLETKTMQLLPHDPKYLLTRKLNASYHPERKTGRWTRFMEEVLPDRQVREYLQRVCGYMLTGAMNERIMILIHGESGTGKTQFLEALYHVMGDFAGIAPASAFQPRMPGHTGPTEGLHKLKGKRFVMQSELDAGSKLNESLVKSITGADTQTTRPLYGAPVDWKPEYTVFMATNYLPRISSSDNAIWNRVKPIKFEQVFVDSTGQALDPGSRNIGRKMAEEESDVIFNWILDGLIAYREQGLNEPQQIRDWLSAYRDDVDVVRQFLAEGQEDGRIIMKEDGQVTVRELHNSFVAFCQDNNMMALGSKTFNERMKSAGWQTHRMNTGVYWQGIVLGGFIREAQTSSMARGFHPRR